MTVQLPGPAEYLVLVYATYTVKPANPPDTQRRVAAAGGGPSKQGGNIPDEEEPVRAFQGTCSVSLTLKADFDYGITGTWTGTSITCEAKTRVQHKLKVRNTWFSSPLNTNMDRARAFLYHGLDPVDYDFRIEFTGTDSVTRTGAAVTAMPRGDASATPDVGRAENVRLEMRNDNDANVYWNAPTSTPTWRSVAGFYVEWREDVKKGTTLTRAQCSKVPEGVVTGTRDRLYLADDRAARPGLCDYDMDPSTQEDDTRSVMIGLTEGTAYRAQVVTKLTLDSDPSDVTHAYSAATRLPQTAMYEPMKVWFIDGTPNYNADFGRTFMMVETNRINSTAACYINGGTKINCPPRTLVSLDTHPGGSYSIRATGSAGSESFGNSQVMRLENVHAEAHEGGQVPENLRVSAGADRMLVSWDRASLHANADTEAKLARIDGYVIQTRHSNDGGSNWSNWAAAATIAKSDCIAAYGGRAHCEKLLTGLNHQMYQVRVSLRTLHNQLRAGSTELNVADASGITVNDVILIGNERMLVTAKYGNTLTVTRGHAGTTAATHSSGAAVYLATQPTTLAQSLFLGMSSFDSTITMPTSPTGRPGVITTPRVKCPDVGKLTIEWDPPADYGGAEVYGYVLYYRVFGSSAAPTEIEIYPRDLLRYCGGTGVACTNPRSVALTGLTGGTHYAIGIAALNVNGRGPFLSTPGNPAPDRPIKLVGNTGGLGATR